MGQAGGRWVVEGEDVGAYFAFPGWRREREGGTVRQRHDLLGS